MNNPGLMCSGKSRGYLNTDVEYLGDRELTLLQVLAQGLAVYELHGNKTGAIELAYLVNVSNVGMVQGCRGFSLLHKAMHALRIVCDFTRQNLESDGPFQLHILSQVDFTHSA